MSSAIWTESGASSKLRSLTVQPWRVVESQHRVATRKLVDSDREQQVLEELLEASKPPSTADRRLHYLLSTPFRYPPLPRGTRFASRWEPSLWYGSDALATAFAEVAYYRFVFLEGTEAELGKIEADLTSFRASASTSRGVDLTAPRFSRWQHAIRSKTTYVDTQPLGDAMRAAGVEIVRYPSARADGTNLGVFSPRAFTSRRPQSLQSWYSIATRDVVECSTRDYFSDDRFRFERESFLVGSILPCPALGDAGS